MANKTTIHENMKQRNELARRAKAEIEGTHEYALARESAIKAAEDKQKILLKMSQRLGQKTGHAQAFGAMKLLCEYLEWKSLAEIVDSKETIEKLGFNTVDDYFEAVGLSRSEAYRRVKIARTLTPEEVSFLGQIGLTRKDLLGYASLPDEERLQIKEGKLLNLETAGKEDIRQLIEDIIAENKAKDKVIETKQKALDSSHKREGKLNHDLEEAKKRLEDDRKRLYGDVIVKFAPDDQHAMEQLHYAHDQIWLAMTALASIDQTKVSLDFINIAAGLCAHISKLASERFTDIVEVRPEVGVYGINADEQYWERLPFNAQTKE